MPVLERSPQPDNPRAGAGRFRERGVRRRVVGGGVVGTGAALDAATRGLSVALVEARDFASGTSSRSSQAHPRRPALPGAARLRAGPRGAARARAAAGPHRAAPRPAGAVPVPAAATAAGSAPTSAPASSLYDTMGPRRPPRGSRPHATSRARRRCASSPGAEAGRAHRRDPVLRRAGRRRAAHDVRRPHRRGLRRRRSPTAPRSIGFLREGERVTGVRVRDLETGGEHRGPRPAGRSTPPACGPTTSRTWSAGAASSTSARPRASTSSCRATGSTRTPG